MLPNLAGSQPAGGRAGTIQRAGRAEGGVARSLKAIAVAAISKQALRKRRGRANASAEIEAAVNDYGRAVADVLQQLCALHSPITHRLWQTGSGECSACCLTLQRLYTHPDQLFTQQRKKCTHAFVQAKAANQYRLPARSSRVYPRAHTRALSCGRAAFEQRAARCLIWARADSWLGVNKPSPDNKVATIRRLV